MASIKCGNCSAHHSSVQEVRDCYSGSLTFNQDLPEREANRGYESSGVTQVLNRVGVPMITERQEAFLNSLLAERPSQRDVENMFPENVAKLTKREASDWIQTVKATPKEVHQGSGKASAGSLNNLLEGIEDGYFALPSKTGNNDLDFIRVGTNQGRVNPERKGWRKIQRVVGGQGNVTISVAEAVVFARTIAKMSTVDRKASMVLFGQEIGSCGKCGRTLTDEASRAAGIGPVCAEAF